MNLISASDRYQISYDLSVAFNTMLPHIDWKQFHKETIHDKEKVIFQQNLLKEQISTWVSSSLS